MPEASRLSFKLIGGDPGHRPAPANILTFDGLVDWIKAQKFDEYTTQKLIEMAAKYPNSALSTFKKNFSLMLQRVRSQREKEQIGEIDAESEENESKLDQKENHQEVPKENFNQRAEIV